MSGRKSVFSLAALLALALCAFAAVSAQAAEQRAFGCNAVTSGAQFSDAHCKTASSTNPGFAAEEIANGTATAIVGTNAKTASETTAAEVSKLSGTLSGIETELQCTGLSGSGSMTNSATSVSGTGTIVYSGCTVTKPAGRGCIVKESKVTTKELKATDSGLGENANKLKFEPNSGTKFAEITLENCLNNKPPNETYPVSGSVIGNTTGATTTTTIATTKAAGTLTFGGNAAGIEGALTISKEGGNPLFLK